MIDVKRWGYLVLLIGIAMTAQTHDSDYVAPSEAVPRGKAAQDASRIAEPW
jgi:hypothetical protein